MRKGKIAVLNERIKELEKELELKNIENKKFAEIFVANISHEVRTPLNAIIGFSGLLRSKDIPISKKEQFLIHINDSTERLLFLIDNIIELSFVQNGNMNLNFERISLSDILQNAYYYANHLKEKYRKHNITLIYDHTEIDHYEDFYSDDFRISLVLKNLLNNAFKYTANGFIEFGCNVKNQILEFYIKDTGFGMHNSKDISFNSFNKNEIGYLCESEGLGIGLSVCEGIINNIGGKIWYKNNSTKGTVFYFTIPYLRSKTVTNNDYKEKVCVS